MARTKDNSGRFAAFRRARRSRKGALIAVAVLIAGGGTAIGVALGSQQHAPQPGQAAAGSTGPPTPGATGGKPPASSLPLPWSGETAQQLEAVEGPTLPRSAPETLTVAAVGISSKLLHLGLARDGTMQVPPLFGQPSEAGWYEYSPTPGQIGPSIIIGHIDTHTGPSVFYRLGAIRPGDEVDVGLADGTTAVFRVTGVRQYSKAEFPVPYGLRPDQQCGPAAHHVRRRFRPRHRPLSGQHGGFRRAGVRPFIAPRSGQDPAQPRRPTPGRGQGHGGQPAPGRDQPRATGHPGEAWSSRSQFQGEGHNSRKIVTGPSLTRLTFMSAPKMPVSTRAPRSCRAETTAPTSGSATGPGRGGQPGRAAALAGVGVERELADDEQRRRDVGARFLAVEDAQVPQLGRQLRGLFRRVIVGDSHQDEQAWLADGPHHLPVNGHAGLADPLRHRPHRVLLSPGLPARSPGAE